MLIRSPPSMDIDFGDYGEENKNSKTLFTEESIYKNTNTSFNDMLENHFERHDIEEGKIGYYFFQSKIENPNSKFETFLLWLSSSHTTKMPVAP